jgi:hypothetical protein
MLIDPILTPENKFPLGQKIALPGHFLGPVTLEGIRFIGSGYECRVRLDDGTPDEAILSLEEAAALRPFPSAIEDFTFCASPSSVESLILFGTGIFLCAHNCLNKNH